MAVVVAGQEGHTREKGRGGEGVKGRGLLWAGGVGGCLVVGACYRSARLVTPTRDNTISRFVTLVGCPTIALGLSWAVNHTLIWMSDGIWLLLPPIEGE